MGEAKRRKALGLAPRERQLAWQGEAGSQRAIQTIEGALTYYPADPSGCFMSVLSNPIDPKDEHGHGFSDQQLASIREWLHQNKARFAVYGDASIHLLREDQTWIRLAAEDL